MITTSQARQRERESTYVIARNEQSNTKRPSSVPLSLNLWLWLYQLSYKPTSHTERQQRKNTTEKHEIQLAMTTKINRASKRL